MSESAKYAGYVRRDTPIDWSQVASDVVDKLGDIEKDKAAFREKNDKLAADAISKVSEYEAGQNPELNQLAYDMIADGRSTISSLHDKLKRREISPDAYNRALMSMQEQNASFQNILTTYNTDLERINKGLDDGTLGAGSQWMVDKLANISDLRDKKFQWVPNKNGITNLYVTSVDEDGNMIKEPMSLGSVRDLGKTDFVKYDLPGDVNKLVKSMQVYTDPSGRIRDVRQNPEYQKAKESTINVAIADNNQVLSILADYGDFTVYGEGDEVPTEKITVEMSDGKKVEIPKGIKMGLNRNGQYGPEVTPELKAAAKKIVSDDIEGRVGRVVTPYTPRRGDDKDPSGYSNKDIARISEGYDATISASEGDFKFMDNTKYKFFKDPDGKGGFTITVTDKKSDKILLSGLESGSRETAKALAPYYTEKFGGTDWSYIDKDKKRKPKKDPTFTPRTYKLEDNIGDIDVIEDIGTTSNSDILQSQAKIKKLILRSSPNAIVDFGKLDDTGVISELKVIVNGKEFNIKTDASYAQKINPFSTYDQENKDTFEEMINHSYGEKDFG